jgi:transposase, IS5 family
MRFFVYLLGLLCKLDKHSRDMRTKFERNPDLFTIPISSATFRKNTRDEAPKLLKGLQAIYMNEELNASVFSLLSQSINPKQEKLEKSGRKGMGLWEILVLGVMRQGLNTNYDRIHHFANNDILMRTVMGIESESNLDQNRKQYGLTTIKDNLALLDEQTIDKVNNIVVQYGHTLLKKKEETLQVKADSFPVGANVHFPTDMNLLWDSARKCIDICEWFRDNENLKGWRKSKLWKRDIKSIFRASSKASSSGGKNKEQRVNNVVSAYLSLCKRLAIKVNTVLNNSACFTSALALTQNIQLGYFYEMLIKHIDLLERRIIKGEVIPSEEKLYSIFETHAEWLTKGKKFKPVEIGHNVLIATDQFNFIIHHKVMYGQTDVQITEEIASALVLKFPNMIDSLSFDKGFYSLKNREFVEDLIPNTIMPKKGKRNKQETQKEHDPKFIRLRNAHSAVESNINQLEHNGLGRCQDRGEENFNRYAALSVLAYNLHKLGENLSKEKALKKAA